MKIYILVINDIANMGYNCEDVEVFAERKKAIERMKALYLGKCEEYKIENPSEKGSLDFGCTDEYAFIFGEYYLDIFEKEI